MKIINKDFVVGGHKVGIYPIYTDISPDFVPMEPGVRVLPAAFFSQKDHFTLKRRYLPGDKPTFPKGGYEVFGSNGEIRSYDVEDVILYPETRAQKKIIDAMAPADPDAPVRGRKVSSTPKEIKVTSGRRGRPALSPEAKAAKEEQAALNALKSGGKRGRPAREGGPKPAKESTGGKRGRPRMTEADIALKVADKALRASKSGGKRGRPSNPKRK